MVPAGSAVNRVASDLSSVSPDRYGKLSTASLFATYNVLPTSAMPMGEFKPLAFATRIVGRMDLVGATNSGDGPYSAFVVGIAARQGKPPGMVNMTSAVNATRRSFTMINHGAPDMAQDTRIRRHCLSDVS